MIPPLGRGTIAYLPWSVLRGRAREGADRKSNCVWTMNDSTARLLKVARPLRRQSSRLVVALYGRGLGRVVANWLLLLTTRGRRSGRQYTTPIGYMSADPSRLHPSPGTVVYLFRAAPGGADWLANLRAQPAVRVRIGRCHYQAQASILRGEGQRRQALAGYLYGHTLPARAARRAFGLDRARPDESIAHAARATQPVIVALRLDNPTPAHGA